jgi:hypothetical protein
MGRNVNRTGPENRQAATISPVVVTSSEEKSQKMFIRFMTFTDPMKHDERF